MSFCFNEPIDENNKNVGLSITETSDTGSNDIKEKTTNTLIFRKMLYIFMTFDLSYRLGIHRSRVGARAHRIKEEFFLKKLGLIMKQDCHHDPVPEPTE